MDCTCAKHEAVERELENLRQQSMRSEARINLLEISTAKIDTNYANIIKDISGISASINQLKELIDGIKSNPEKRFDMLINSAVSILGIVIASLIIYKLTGR